MISMEQMAYSLLAAGGYLLVISLVLDWIERKLKLTAALPQEIVEKADLGSTVANFILELIFYVAMPAVVYGFFYYLMPFYGARGGMACALFAFALGGAPALIGLSLRVKLPTPYLFYTLLAILVKLLGCLAIIGYLNTL
jgi:hypothetical protein